MSKFDVAALNRFYEWVSGVDGIPIADLRAELARLFALPRSETDLNAYRLGRLPWKKLSDEITPVSRYLQWHRITTGRVRFPLDSHPPDCWLWPNNRVVGVGIEVTIAQARERLHLAQEMIRTGRGRGFIGVSDDAPQADFDHAMSIPRVMYSTEQALSAIHRGIDRCLSRKNRSAFAGLTLLIQAPLSSLPYERWRTIVGDLRAAAAVLPFRRAYVVGNADEPLRGFRIK